MRMNNKRGFEFGFGWLFAIIVGAVIIFLAIYSTTNLVKTERTKSDTIAAREFGILLDPTSTGLEEGKVSKIIFPTEARIYNNCTLKNNEFGSQKIAVSTRSEGLGKEWEKPGVTTSFHSKYIFSSKVAQSKQFEIFSKPFYFPFKVADLTFILDRDYCFVNPTDEIEEELESLKPSRIKVVSSAGACAKNSTKVCFFGSGCDINVIENSNKVVRKDGVVYYEGALVYGAIFADVETYECQVQRIMRRASELSSMYLEKSQTLGGQGCPSNLEGYLSNYASKADELKRSISLSGISVISKDMEAKNGLLTCKLF